jgi:prophage antirepressor-like protein
MSDEKNPIQAFDFKGHEVRTVIEQDGEPWWIAADVCDVLGLDQTSRAINRLDDHEKGVTTITTPGGPQQMAIINESGLWSLVLTSRKAEAKAFKKWLTSVVIPALRKTGRYEMPGSQQPPTALDSLARALTCLVETMEDERRERKVLSAKVSHMARQVEKLNSVTLLPLRVVPSGWGLLVKFADSYGILLDRGQAKAEATICIRACKRLGVKPLRYQYREGGIAINLYPENVLAYWLNSYRKRNGFKAVPVLPFKS